MLRRKQRLLYQGTPKTSGKPPEVRKNMYDRFFLIDFRRRQLSFQTYGLQNCDTINLCCSSHPVCNRSLCKLTQLFKLSHILKKGMFLSTSKENPLNHWHILSCLLRVSVLPMNFSHTREFLLTVYFMDL